MRPEGGGEGARLTLIALMGVCVLLANVLVELPINAWLTWGAFVYPLTFLITDLTNRSFGPRNARMVALAGFCVGLVLSLVLADLRIALASGTAFCVGQVLDIEIFHRLRQQAWWQAPLVSSVLASGADTALFFALAFVGTGVNWVQLGLGDFAAKLLMAGVCLGVYRLASVRMPQPLR